MAWPLLLLLTVAAAQAQPRIDSLHAHLEHAEGRERVDLLNEMTAAYAGEAPEEGLRTGNAAFEEAVELDYIRGQADALFNVGLVQYRLGTHAEAIHSYQQALDLYRTLQDDEALGYCYNRLGNALGRSGHYVEAVDAFEAAIELLEQESQRSGAGHALTNLGLLHWRRGYYGKALPHYQRALKLWEGDEKKTASTLNNIGTIYFQWGRYENALAAYKRSLSLRKELKDDRGVALVLNNIGLTYQEWGYLDHAYEVYQDAHARVQTLGNDMVVGYTLNNLGTALQERGAYEEALAHFQQSLEVYEAAQNRGGHIMNLISIGKLYHEQGRDEEALQQLEAAREHAHAEGIREREAAAAFEIGIVYQSREDAPAAREHFQRSLALSQAMQKRSLVMDNYRRLAAVHEDLGDHVQALQFYKAYQSLEDSLYDERSQRLLADLEMQYEAEKREKENVMLRAEQERSRLVIALGGLVLAIVLFATGVLYFMNHQKREANQKLAISNDRIAHQRDENMVLLHILSHDLANVLGNVRNCLRLMLEEPGALGEFGPMALQVNSNGIEMIELVRQMHALEVGKLELEAVNLRDAVDEAALVLRDRLNAKEIALENRVDSAWMVVVERISFVNSVLANVLTNAIKFSERQQSVQVEAEALEGGSAVRLVVRDHGTGMSEEVRDRLFDLEQSTSRPGTEGEQGNGFGMPLVKRFVVLYGGHIEVYSREAHAAPDDHGTEVSIVLKADSVSTSTDDHGRPFAVVGAPVQG